MPVYLPLKFKLLSFYSTVENILKFDIIVATLIIKHIKKIPQGQNLENREAIG